MNIFCFSALGQSRKTGEKSQFLTIRVVAKDKAAAEGILREKGVRLAVDLKGAEIPPEYYWLENIESDSPESSVIVERYRNFVFRLKNAFGAWLPTVIVVMARNAEEAQEALKQRKLTIYENSGTAGFDLLSIHDHGSIVQLFDVRTDET